MFKASSERSIKDDKVINSIIKQLRFRKNGRIGVIAGLPMVDKIRVGMSVDFYRQLYNWISQRRADLSKTRCRPYVS